MAGDDDRDTQHPDDDTPSALVPGAAGTGGVATGGASPVAGAASDEAESGVGLVEDDDTDPDEPG